MIITKSQGKLLMIFSAFVASLGQLMWKLSGSELNILLIIGLFLYGIGFISMTIAFKSDELSKLYPFMSLSYAFATIYSVLILREPLSISNIIGIILIVSGVILLGSDKPCSTCL
ncbi:EamA family transporter [Oceanirhabdus seepicola]|uniref:EamA family transporter n=1 Tax=Oceanirhabdus seepicola TaxID=2828781 RepID=A0A9J6NZH2_9CLOT|nr:EamA family transporter [Oceanirhabdus seepicola]MCM1988544.1 EamA family transporter [Oceanirhabdus seepicola]